MNETELDDFPRLPELRDLALGVYPLIEHRSSDGLCCQNTLIHKDAAQILKAQYILAIKQAKTHFFIELLRPHYASTVVLRLSDLPTSDSKF